LFTWVSIMAGQCMQLVAIGNMNKAMQLKPINVAFGFQVATAAGVILRHDDIIQKISVARRLDAATLQIAQTAALGVYSLINPVELHVGPHMINASSTLAMFIAAEHAQITLRANVHRVDAQTWEAIVFMPTCPIALLAISMVNVRVVNDTPDSLVNLHGAMVYDEPNTQFSSCRDALIQQAYNLPMIRTLEKTLTCAPMSPRRTIDGAPPQKKQRVGVRSIVIPPQLTSPIYLIPVDSDGNIISAEDATNFVTPVLTGLATAGGSSDNETHICRSNGVGDLRDLQCLDANRRPAVWKLTVSPTLVGKYLSATPETLCFNDGPMCHVGYKPSPIAAWKIVVFKRLQCAHMDGALFPMRHPKLQDRAHWTHVAAVPRDSWIRSPLTEPSTQSELAVNDTQADNKDNKADEDDEGDDDWLVELGMFDDIDVMPGPHPEE
jgi:hypothetical protein